MSNRIDQRIVEMSFENHKFEKGIHQSKNSLREFSDALKNMGNGKDFSGLENSVQSVSSSFSMLEQIGIGALRRIGEAAVNAGGTLVKSLTVDQLSAGLSKYQEKIEAVQTMVSAGYGLEEVEKSMEQLMWFSDETSYSFADMAGNMAKFITAGVDLKTSERAMQGIATWAAHSGKNSQAASIAMFNLSQAISLGYVDTRNWQSIMNQNMNTTMFKQIAIGVAEATGAVKKGQVTIQNFDSNLKDKWFTNDVLLKTLDQYSAYADKVRQVQEEMNFDTAKQAMDYMDAHADQYTDVINQIGNAAFKASQESKSFMDSINATMDAVSSGWLRTYEIIFGTLYEAKENFSALTEVLWTVFASSAEGRNEMLQAIKDAGGIKSIFQIIKNVAVATLKPLKAISEAFDQFFPPRTVNQWMNVINILETISKRLIITDETASKIQRTFAGFFAIVDIGWQTTKFLGSALYEIINVFIPLNGNLLEMTASIGDFLVMLNHLIKQSGIFQYGLLGIKIATVIVRDVISNIVGKIKEFVNVLWTTDKPLQFIGQTIQNIFSGILSSLKTGVSWISGKFMGALSTVQKFLNTKFNIGDAGFIGEILKVLKDFIDFIVTEATDGLFNFGDALNNLDFNKIATFVTGGVLLLFINQLTNLTKTANSLVATTNTFVSKFSKKLFGTTTKIKDLAYVFGILSASLFVLSKIPWNELARGFVGLAGALVIFVGAYAAVQAITVRSSKAMDGRELVKSTFSIVTLAASVAIMAVAVKRIASPGTKDVWNAVLVIGAMMGLLTAYQALSAVISLIPGQQAVAVKFSGMTFGVMGLVGIVAILKVITRDDLREGLSKIDELVWMLTGIQLLFGFAARIGGGNKLSTSILGVSMGILTLIGVMKLLDVIKIEDLKDQVINVVLLGGLLSAIQVMFGIASRISGGAKFKTNILTMQVGMLTMIGLIELLKTFTPQEIQNGIQTIAKMALIIAGLEIFTALAARLGGGAKLQKILGAVTLTMLSFVALIGLLNIYKDQGIVDNGIVAIAKMMDVIVRFELLSAAASRISGGGLSGLTSMIGLVGALLAVTASIALLAVGGQDELRQAAISFSIAVAAVGVMASGIGILSKYLSGLSTGLSGFRTIIQNLIPGLTAMGIVIVATLAFLGIVKLASSLIKSISWDSLDKFAIGLGLVTTLVTAFTLLAKVPGLKTGAGLLALLPGFVAMGGVLFATKKLFQVIESILPIIDNISFDSFGKFIDGLKLISTLVVGMGALGAIFSAVGVAFVPAIAGIGAALIGMVLIIGAFVGLAALMDLLDSGILISGFNTLTIVGEGIGRFFGAIAGGFSTEAMIGYGKGLAGFADVVKQIDPASFGGVESLAKALLILTGTSILDGLSRFINFGKNPGEVFGEQLKGLIKAFKGITPEDAIQTSSVLSALTPMSENLKTLADATQAIPNSGGLLGVFLGNNDVDDFGKNITKFIKSLNKIDTAQASHVAGVFIALQPMLEGFKNFISATGDIPNTGWSVISWWVGNNDIDTFGKKITKFVKSLNKIDTAQASHTAGVFIALQPMLEGFKNFIIATSSIPNSDGVLGNILGNNDIDDFGKKITKFVKSLNKIDTAQASHTAGVFIALQPMLEGFKNFISATGDIPNTGGSVISWWVGNNDIDTFGKQISKFVKSLSGLDSGKVTNASTNLKVMASDMLPGLRRFITLSNELQEGAWAQSQALPMLNLATTIKEFVKTLKGVDVSVVAPALKSLAGINESFKDIGSEVISNATKSFENNKQPFQLAIIKLLNETTTAVESRKEPIATSFSNVIKYALEKSREYIGDFKTLGFDIARGLQSGINSGQSIGTKATTTMTKNVVRAATQGFQVNSPSKVFDGIGRWLGIGLGNGIKRNSNVAILASANMAQGVEDAVRDGLDVHSESKKFNGIGEWASTSLGSGIQNGKETLLNIAKKLGIDTGNITVKGITESIGQGEGAVTTGINSLLELLTGEKTVSEIVTATNVSGNKAGTAFADGVAKSIGSSSSKQKVKKSAAELAEDAFQAFKKQMDYLTEYDLITPEVEISKWEEFTKKQVEGTETRLKAEKKLNELKFNYSKNWIDKEKYYKRLSLEDELAAWERVQDRYKKGHAYRLQAEREIFRLKQEIQQLDYQNAMDQIDEDKYYGRLNLSQELKRYKQIQSTLEENSDNRKRINREIFRVEKEIRDATLNYEEEIGRIESGRHEKRIQLEQDYYNKTKEINDKLSRDIQALNDEYENAVASRAKTLYSTWGIFEKVDPFQPINGDELFKNLEDQVVAFDQWQAQIGILAAKGIDQGLVEELRSMGPKSLPQILALNKMTDSQLNGYVSLWQKKSREAKDQAIYELQGMKEETAMKIQELTRDADNELSYYKQVWKDSLRDVNDDADRQLDVLEQNWKKTMGDMTADGINTVDQFKTDLSGTMTEVVGETDTKMGELEQNNKDTLQGINNDTTQQLNTLKQDWSKNIAGMTSNGIRYIKQFRSDWSMEISGIVSNTRTQMSELTRLVNSMNDMARNVTNGLANGINNNANTVKKAGQNIGNSVIRGANQILMINSPSRKFMEIGKYSVEGLAEGLRRFSGLVYAEGTSVGRTALEAVSLSMDSIPDMLGNDVNSFTITPVLDLSDVRAGMNDMNSILNNTSGLGLGLETTMSLLPSSNVANQNGILTELKDVLMNVTNQEVDLTGTLTVQVVNDKGEIVEIAETAIKDILRRESR